MNIEKGVRFIYSASSFMIVLEAMPEEAAISVKNQINIPTIEIGAGRFTDGQVLVFNPKVR